MDARLSSTGIQPEDRMQQAGHKFRISADGAPFAYK
jgi:hypothetical protein